MSEHTNAARVRQALGLLPLPVYITGRNRDLLLGLLDRWLAPALDVPVTITTKGGDWTLDLSQPNQRILYYAFENVRFGYERSGLAQIMRRARKLGGRRFYDVGANLGMYAMLGEHMGFETIALEPEPLHAGFLETNAAHFGERRAVAVSDAPGTSSFFVANASNPGASSLVLSEASVETSTIYERSVEVPVARLDALVEQDLGHEVGALDVIKIDVEGHEEAAVRGGSAIWERGPMLWCEVRGPQSGRAPSSFAKVTALMKEAGYRAWSPGFRPWPTFKLEPFTGAHDQVRQVFDLLYLRDYEHAELLRDLT